MKRADKNALIEELKEKISSTEHFYITDSSALTVAAVNDFRRQCFENDIEFKVAKNT
ncbi:MAG: 50S ribosomal protein L10, partial [Chitinophagales bacterium]|nr:50S ribosomal protein L10 [Chitinophagales bacterium]